MSGTSEFTGGAAPGQPFALSDARVLVVDDEHDVGRTISRILTRAGCGSVVVESDPREGLDRCRQKDMDAILLDLHMPGVDGFEFLDALKRLYDPEEYLPVLILTGEPSIHVRSRALQSGAKDFVQKPFEPTEVAARVNNLVQTGRMHRRLRSFNAELEVRVREQTAEAVLAKVEVLERLARAGEYRDDMTGLHAQRVGHLSALIAGELGLSRERIETIRKAAPLHDIGKIGVPDSILLKQGSLTQEELLQVRQHAVIGSDILSGSTHPLLQAAERVARTHHEFWDGRGYPAGLKGEHIPLEGRIVAVADAFDSMTNDRPYRLACSHGAAVAEVVRVRGRQFDPAAADALCSLFHRGVLKQTFPAGEAGDGTDAVSLRLASEASFAATSVA